MKKLVASLLILTVLSIPPALAADSQPQAAPGKTQPATKEAASKKPAEKQKSPGTMEKAGNSLKSGWNRFTQSVKQGRKQPDCTPEQKSLKQC